MKKSSVLLIIGIAVLFAIGGGIMMSPAVQKLAEAIARAEGFYVAGSRSQRNHNPGDISRDITGTAIGNDNGLMIYASDTDGWNALYKQVSEMLDGTSQFYNPSMTISQVAQVYAENWIPWANNVANYLGISTDTPIGQII